jgi:carbon storage regulator
MLIIRRRVGESLVIQSDVEVEVLEITGSQVKLGIRAPKTVPVMRKEMDVVRQENRQAMHWPERAAMDYLKDSFKLLRAGPDKPHE